MGSTNRGGKGVIRSRRDQYLLGASSLLAYQRDYMKTPPPSISRDKPVTYANFHLIPETRTDGWTYGAMTVYDDNQDGCREGDGFVEAPDGARAGLDWIVGKHPGRLRLVARGGSEAMGGL